MDKVGRVHRIGSEIGDRVGFEGECLGRVSGRANPGLFAAKYLTEIFSVLLGRIHNDASDLVVGVVEEIPEDRLADKASPPNDDAIAHDFSKIGIDRFPQYDSPGIPR